MHEEETRGVSGATAPRIEVGACYSRAWGALKKYPLEVFLVTVVASIVSLPGWALMDAGGEMGRGNDVLSVLGVIYLVLVTRPFKYGAFHAFLKAVRGVRLEVKSMFDFFENYLNVVLANLFVLVIVAIGAALFIIPGVFFACRLSFTPFLVVERKMEAIDAVKESWRLTRGNAWTVFLIALLAIPILVLGLALFGVGIIGAMMWVGLAHSALYDAVVSSEGARAAGTGPEDAVAPAGKA